MAHLSLSEALRTGRVDAFVTQAEAAGVGPVSKADFDESVRRVAVTRPQLSGRTSRSQSGDGSGGK